MHPTPMTVPHADHCLLTAPPRRCSNLAGTSFKYMYCADTITVSNLISDLPVYEVRMEKIA